VSDEAAVLYNATPRPERDVEDKFVHLDRLRIHYRDWGTRNDHVVVLLHGLTSQSHQWDTIADALKDQFRVICPDLRGHGDSDWTPDGYYCPLLAGDLAQLTDTLQLRDFALVGYSLGARAALAYAGGHPHRLTHLVLVDAGPEVSRASALSVRSRVQQGAAKRGFRTTDEALDDLRQRYPAWRSEFHELEVRYELKRNWAGMLTHKHDPELYWLTDRAGLQDVPYLWEMARHVDVPTLIMRGESSDVLDETIVEKMLAAIPDARMITFSTGHSIPREDPDRFLTELRAFIGGPAG
jgi:pimeloyl-ACP methyl ester carboxylesterase